MLGLLQGLLEGGGDEELCEILADELDSIRVGLCTEALDRLSYSSPAQGLPPSPDLKSLAKRFASLYDNIQLFAKSCHSVTGALFPTVLCRYRERITLFVYSNL